MIEHPTIKWLKQYEIVKNQLQSPIDLNRYFTEQEIAGRKLEILEIGTYTFPSGKIIVHDPLVHLCQDPTPYFLEIPPGNYPLSIAVVEVEDNHYRYAAARLKISGQQAVVYQEALTGHENLGSLTNEGDFFGFNVDAGLATLIDEKVKEAWCAFKKEWHKQNNDGNTNIYDHLLAGEFRKSYLAQPRFQRSGGDWVRYQIPGTKYQVPMFQSGWGDGVYPVYFGMDAQETICEVVIHFIDIELEIDNEDYEDE